MGSNEADIGETVRNLRSASENVRVLTEYAQAASMEPYSNQAARRSEGSAMKKPGSRVYGSNRARRMWERSLPHDLCP